MHSPALKALSTKFRNLSGNVTAAKALADQQTEADAKALAARYVAANTEAANKAVDDEVQAG